MITESDRTERSASAEFWARLLVASKAGRELRVDDPADAGYGSWASLDAALRARLRGTDRMLHAAKREGAYAFWIGPRPRSARAS